MRTRGNAPAETTAVKMLIHQHVIDGRPVMEFYKARAIENVEPFKYRRLANGMVVKLR